MFVEPYDYDEDRPWGPGCLLGLAVIAVTWLAIGLGVYWLLCR